MRKTVIILSVLALVISGCGRNNRLKVLETKGENSVVSETTNTEQNTNLSSSIIQFIPENYAVLDTTSGDLNLDQYMDMIVVLKKKGEDTISNAVEHPEKRPLLILLGQADNIYKLVAHNDNAVYCVDCGGMMRDPFMQIVIKNGYFSIEHGIAEGQHWEQIITFKYDKIKDNWFLYKNHFVSYKLNDSNDENAEALVKDVDKLETERDFGTIPFDKFDIYEKH